MINLFRSGDSRGREHRIYVHADQGGRGGRAEQDPVGALRAGLTPAARAPPARPPRPPRAQTQGRHLLRTPPAPRPRAPPPARAPPRLLLLGPGPGGPAASQEGAAPQRLHRLRHQVLLRTRRQVLRD